MLPPTILTEKGDILPHHPQRLGGQREGAIVQGGDFDPLVGRGINRHVGLIRRTTLCMRQGGILPSIEGIVTGQCGRCLANLIEGACPRCRKEREKE